MKRFQCDGARLHQHEQNRKRKLVARNRDNAVALVTAGTKGRFAGVCVHSTLIVIEAYSLWCKLYTHRAFPGEPCQARRWMCARHRRLRGGGTW